MGIARLMAGGFLSDEKKKRIQEQQQYRKLPNTKKKHNTE